MINRIHWTDHAQERLKERGPTREEVEDIVRSQHASREINHGEADWRVYGVRLDGRRFAVIYDHPVLGEPAVARIVSIWTLRN